MLQQIERALNLLVAAQTEGRQMQEVQNALNQRRKERTRYKDALCGHKKFIQRLQKVARQTTGEITQLEDANHAVKFALHALQATASSQEAAMEVKLITEPTTRGGCYQDHGRLLVNPTSRQQTLIRTAIIENIAFRKEKIEELEAAIAKLGSDTPLKNKLATLKKSIAAKKKEAQRIIKEVNREEAARWEQDKGTAFEESPENYAELVEIRLQTYPILRERGEYLIKYVTPGTQGKVPLVTRRNAKLYPLLSWKYFFFWHALVFRPLKGRLALLTRYGGRFEIRAYLDHLGNVRF